jgi:hypothetical protein
MELNKSGVKQSPSQPHLKLVALKTLRRRRANIRWVTVGTNGEHPSSKVSLSSLQVVRNFEYPNAAGAWILILTVSDIMPLV